MIAESAGAFCAIATTVHLASLAIAGARCRRRMSCPAAPHPSGGVTLLRPVCGVEPFAAETLASGFGLAYPNYETVFCVARREDVSIPLVLRLIAANPQASARLLVGDDRLCVNPKLNNLVKGWRAAEHRWILMADSNVLLPPDALQQMLSRWRRDIGAVCSMPLGTRPAGFWAELECAFLNTHQARFQYVSETLGCGFAQGKAMLLDRQLVDAAGGIAALAFDPAEDAALTKIVRRAGRRVRLVDRPFVQPLGRRRAAEVWARQLRWARLRRNSFTWLFLPEALVGSALPSLALVVAAAHYGGSPALSVGLLLAVWYGAEAALARYAGWHFSPRMPAAFALRDLLLPALWMAAWAGSEFVWRGTPMDMREQPDVSQAADLTA